MVIQCRESMHGSGEEIALVEALTRYISNYRQTEIRNEVAPKRKSNSSSGGQMQKNTCMLFLSNMQIHIHCTYIYCLICRTP